MLEPARLEHKVLYARNRYLGFTFGDPFTVLLTRASVLVLLRWYSVPRGL